MHPAGPTTTPQLYDPARISYSHIPRAILHTRAASTLYLLKIYLQISHPVLHTLSRGTLEADGRSRSTVELTRSSFVPLTDATGRSDFAACIEREYSLVHSSTQVTSGQCGWRSVLLSSHACRALSPIKSSCDCSQSISASGSVAPAAIRFPTGENEVLCADLHDFVFCFGFGQNKNQNKTFFWSCNGILTCQSKKFLF